MRAPNSWSARTGLLAGTIRGRSTLMNLRRDVFVSDAVGMYGGGFGIGGYQYRLESVQNAECLQGRGAIAITTFAWQVGTGNGRHATKRPRQECGQRNPQPRRLLVGRGVVLLTQADVSVILIPRYVFVLSLGGEVDQGSE